MRNRKIVVGVLACWLAAGTERTGAGERSTEQRLACTPALSSNPALNDAPAEVFDGNISTFWRTAGLIQLHQVTIDLGCVAKLWRFRRYMTCDGTATSGPACNFRSQDGRRHQGLDQVTFSPAAGAPFTKAVATDATGWEAYTFAAPPFGAYTDGLPYGWTPWLDFRTASNPEGVTARFVAFTFVDLADAVNEIEIEYSEPPLSGTADLSVTMTADPAVIDGKEGLASARFVATVVNLGPSVASNVTLDPRGIAFPGAGTTTQGSCSGLPTIPSLIPSCSLGSLPAGQSATVTFNDTATSAPRGAVVRADEPDPVSRNNWAQASVSFVDCENLSQACPLLWLLGEYICKARTGIKVVLSALSALPADPEVFYRLRDEVLRTTPEGRRYIALYERHGGEISRILLTNPSVLDRASTVLPLWEPLFRDLVEKGGSGATLTASHVSALTDLLEDLKRLGSSELRAAIEQEQATLDLPSFVGRTMDDALSRFQRGSCPGGDERLCLQNGRFQASVSWRDSQGNAGAGHAVPLTSDTGSFWFFSPDNVELVVKALDGRGINGRWWVFYGSLSNVQYTLTVTDTATGAVQTYSNPQGAFGSSGDTAAFLPGLAGSAGPPDSPPVGEASELLSALRFKVEVTWRDFQGNTGVGHAVRLTPDTAYFWFFNPENIELVVKALDARIVNGRYWIFYGALSNVEYTVTVTDTVTGVVKTYSNPSGVFASVGDTTAF